MEAWLSAHPALVAFFIVPVIGALINEVTWFESPEEWTLYQIAHPRRARWIRFARALFPVVRKMFPALAAVIPPDATETKTDDKKDGSA